MERVLRKPDISEVEDLFHKSFDTAQNVIYFPVRHHSPACSFHLKQVIDSYNPDLILIEGPSDSGHLLPYIADTQSEPPFCIYYSYDDKEGKVNDEKEKYRAYYPFLEYSPELVAIREGMQRHTEVRFIDLPYSLRLINQREAEPVDTQFYYNENTEYEENSYTALIAIRSGCRSFSEFWEKNFELNATQVETSAFVRNLFFLGYYMRMSTPEKSSVWYEDLLRESYMAEEIRKGVASHKNILVIAGAFHIKGLMEFVDNPQKPVLKPCNPEHVASYLMPYTFKEADSKYGYAAGMPFPAFYQSIWEKMKKGKTGCYEATVLDYIIKTARFARKTQSISLPDEINAYTMAQSLTRLRGKSSAGVYELLDGVKSCFVKGDIHATSTFEIDFLLRLLSGMGAGKIVINDLIPPVVREFRALCAAHRLKTSTVERQEVTLHIIKNPAHYRKSRFLHQLSFLQTGFCILQSGPDYVNQKDKNLMREIWVCRYSTQVETRLIDLSVYGSTLSQVCASIIQKEFRDNLTAAQLGKMLISVQVMGVADFYKTYGEDIYSVVRNEKNFINLCELIGSLHYLVNMQQLTDSETNPFLPRLSRLAFNEAVGLIDSIRQVTGDEEQAIAENIKKLYAYSLEEEYSYDTGSFIRELEDVLNDGFSNSRVWGVSLGIRYKQGGIEQPVFCDRIAVYLESCITRPEQAASFVCGLFLVARDVLFSDERILETIDRVVAGCDNEQFLTILPNLRYAFTSFLPSELNRLGGIIAQIHNLSEDHLTGSNQVSESDIKKGMMLDNLAMEALNHWNM